jgi:hypothetical protein
MAGLVIMTIPVLYAIRESHWLIRFTITSRSVDRRVSISGAMRLGSAVRMPVLSFTQSHAGSMLLSSSLQEQIIRRRQQRRYRLEVLYFIFTQ